MKTLKRFLPSIAICLVVIALGIPIGAVAKGSFSQTQDSGNVSIVESKPTDNPVAFAVSASPIKAFRAPKGDQINANGNQYFVVDESPQKVEAVLIFTEGEHKNWIVVRKVSGGKSVKLIPFAKNQFLFEHSGSGEYEVTSLDENNEPVFDYFEVEGDSPEDPKDPPKDPPTDPKPPVGDFSKLIETAKANANNDLATRKKLAVAWDDVLKTPTTDLAELKKKIGKARSDVLSMVRDQDGSWNKWLISIDNWFKSNPNIDYSLAMKALTQWMNQ